MTVDADSPEWAEVQGVLARGDRRLAPVIWETERLTLRGFHDSLAQHGLSAAEFIGERDAGRVHAVGHRRERRAAQLSPI